MKQKFRTMALYLLSLFFFAAFLHQHAFAEKPLLRYVALGDSLAAGFLNSKELGDGYPVYIAQGIEEETAYQVNLTNFGVGGYTTVHLLEQIDKEHVQQALKEADIITIDIGANDILWKIGTDFDLSNPEEMQRIVNEVSETLLVIKANIGEILTKIQQLNADAPIFFMGYYNALPYLEGQDIIEMMMTIFNNMLKETSESYGAIFVPTYDAFVGKYDIYLPDPSDIHPNEEGYRVIASLFLEKIYPLLPPVISVPEIILHGENPMELHVGDIYVEPGAAAYDSVDGDLTDKIIISGKVDTSKAGTYTVTYRVTNSLGETATAERKVHVLKVDDDIVIPPKDDTQKPSHQTKSDDNLAPVQKDKQVDNGSQNDLKTGSKLPTTATKYPLFILIGVAVAIAGVICLRNQLKITNVS